MKTFSVNNSTLYDFKQFYMKTDFPFSASLDDEKKQPIIKWWIWDSHCLKRVVEEVFYKKPMNKLIPDSRIS